MGLKGRLEDLPFLDMLQIAAFSQKSGCLRVEGPLGSGAVMFKTGLVQCAYSWSTLEHLRFVAQAGLECKNYYSDCTNLSCQLGKIR